MEKPRQHKSDSFDEDWRKFGHRDMDFSDNQDEEQKFQVKWPEEEPHHKERDYVEGNEGDNEDEDFDDIHGFTEEEMNFDGERNEFDSDHEAFKNRFRRKRMREHK